MPTRIIRDGILTSERIQSLGWAEEVFYRRIMSIVDDYGRYYAKPALLRAACYPLLLQKVSDSDIEKWLTACVNSALVRVYPAKDGKRYMEILDFKQRTRTPSKFPSFDEDYSVGGQTSAGCGQMPANVGLVGGVGVVGDEVVCVDVKRQVADAPVVFPQELDCEDFKDAWEQWNTHLKEKKVKRTPTSAQMQLKKLAGMGVDRAIDAIHHSIAGNYQGVYEPTQGNPRAAMTEQKPQEWHFIN
jgi:hypothetical protein